jgi:uncharacterized protein (TIRG00374 family)
VLPKATLSVDAAPTDDTPRWARWVSLIVGIFAVGALGVTLYTVGLGTIWKHLRIIGWWFVPILALEVASAFADAAVIHGFLGSGGRRPSFFRVLEAQVAGRSINLVTPMASLGEATKATMLMRETSSGRAVAAVVRFNMSYVAVNLFVVIAGAPICALVLPLPTWMSRLLWIGSAAALAVVVGVALLLRAGMLSTALRVIRSMRLLSEERSAKLRQRLREIDRSLAGEHGLRSWVPGLWALVSKILGWVIVWIVMYANGQPPSLGVMATLASAGTLVSIVANVAPMGIGISEAGTGALMAALGEQASLGVTTVLARRVMQICYAVIGLTLIATTETVTRKGRGAARKGRGAARKGGGAARKGKGKRDERRDAASQRAEDDGERDKREDRGATSGTRPTAASAESDRAS